MVSPRRPLSRLRWAPVALALSLGFAAPASAATAPTLQAAWAGEVVSTSARLHADIVPNGASTTYHFDYIRAAAFAANLATGKDGFLGAAKLPAGADQTVGAGSQLVEDSKALTGLTPDTAYRYRAVVKNGIGTVIGAAHLLTTQLSGGASTLLDGRAWELVSPADKNGGQVDLPETIAGGGVFQAAAAGGSITYSSASSFAAGAEGAPQGSQYIATRLEGGWATQNITTPMLSGSYGAGPLGVPYQLFSTDLARGLLLNGRHCRAPGAPCPVANPPLPGTDAPPGYQNYYLRQGAGFEALLDAADLQHTAVGPEGFDLDLAGASPDLRHVVLSTCAALVSGATEVPAPGGCDPNQPNLYRFDLGGSLRLLNALPGAELAAPAGAVSADGSRVYWKSLADGNLYLRDGAQLTQVDLAAGDGGSFEAASADGGVAFYTKAGHLWRFQALGGGASDLTPAGGVQGVLAASADGARVYFLSADGLYLNDSAGTRLIAAGGADPVNYPPATGTAHLSADGTRLAFLATAPLSGYDNTDQLDGQPDSQVYLYDALAETLICVSCNPTGARPRGPSSLPGTRANGAAPGSTEAYRPRALSSDGRRLFFDSADDLALGDTNHQLDAYEWEAAGSGDCTRAGGCLALLSSGKDPAPSSFLDASADGIDAFFLTERSLIGADPGSLDLYDARVGGGFPSPPAKIACEGDACQFLPSEPPDQAVSTLVAGPGNPPIRYPKLGKKKSKKKRAKHRRSRHSHRRSEGGSR